MSQRLKKKCLKYKKNLSCEKEFLVDVRVYKRKIYCANCQRLRENDYMREYQLKSRADARAAKDKK